MERLEAGEDLADLFRLAKSATASVMESRYLSPSSGVSFS
jgi:hypothetical protein